jgi:putative transposase
MSKQKRHSPEQIASILNQQEGGLKVSEICRREGISEQTFYRWKSKYGGLGVSEVKRLKALEDENRRLKQLVGEKELDIQALKTIVEGKY